MRKIVITTILTLIALNVFAEKGPVKGGIPKKKVEASRPAITEKYMGQNDLTVLAADSYGQKDAKGYWDVFSDREGNVTYDSPSCKKQYSNLSFREKVRIVKIVRDCALVYSIPDYDSEFPKMLPDDFCKGWIPISNLIICTKPLVTDTGTPKRLLFADERGMDSVGKIVACRYDGPISGASKHSLPDCSNTFFYYIKSAGYYTLLATSEDLSNAENIYGWVETSALLNWDSRIAAEPNWEPTEIKVLEKNNISGDIRISDTEPPTGRIPFKMARNNPYETNSYKLRHGEMRFPYLSSNGLGNGHFAIPSNCRFLNEPAEPLPSGYSGNEIYRNINILFVLDGSRAYEQFFPIIAESLGSMKEKLGEQFIVRVGAIIYHDSRNSKKMMENYPLSDITDDGLFNFIDNGGEYGFKDNLSNAPLCSVMDMAVDYDGFDVSDSNYIVAVGGRGDDSDTETIPSAIAEKMAYRNIKLFGIQVRNDEQSSSYRNFRYYIQDILMNCKQIAVGEDASLRHGINQFGFVRTSFYNGNGTDRDFSGLCCSQSGIMEEDEFSTFYNTLLEDISSDAKGGNMDADTNKAKLFKSVLIDKDNNGVPMLKDCALYSKEELEYLLDFYRQLHEYYILNNPSYRQAIFKKIENYVRNTYPVERLNVKYLESGYIEVFKMIEGLPCDIAYTGEKFKDFAPGKSVSNEYFNHILSIVNQKYQKLESVYCSPEHYSSVLNGETYFWVPLDYLM